MFNIQDIKKIHQFFKDIPIDEIEIQKNDNKIRLSMGRPELPAQPVRVKMSEENISEKNKESIIKESPPTVYEMKSKWVGFFTRLNPKTGENYCKLRDLVKKGDILGHVRVLGVLQDFRSEVDGKVKEILIEEGQPIEYGQPIIRIDIIS